MADQTAYMPTNPHQPSSTEGPSREDWDQQRPLIKRLYFDERKKLKDVISIVSQSGHKATPKMYKDRIASWGYDKKRKERDMLAILRKKNERDSIAKKSLFRVRGRMVTLEEVDQYMKRRSKPCEMNASNASTPSALSCWTPSPPNTPRQIDDDDSTNLFQSKNFGAVAGVFNFHATEEPHSVGTSWSLGPASSADEPNFLDDNDICSLTLDYTSVPRSPLPPQVFIVFERLLSSIKTYVYSSIDPKSWSMHIESDYLNAAPRVCNLATIKFRIYGGLACDSLLNGYALEFRRALSAALTSIPHLIDLQQQNSLVSVFGVLLYFVKCGFRDIAQFLCRYIWSVADNIGLGYISHHHIWQLLAMIDVESLEQSLKQSWRANIDSSIYALRSLDCFALSVYLTYAGCNFDLSLLLKSERHTRKLLLRSRKAYGASSAHFFHTTAKLGANLLRQRRYTEVEAIMHDCLATNLQSLTGRSKANIAIVLFHLAMSQYHQRKMSKAVINIRKALEILTEVFGLHDPMTVGCMRVLELFLREWDRDEEADTYRVRIAELIGKDEIDAEIEAGNIIL